MHSVRCNFKVLIILIALLTGVGLAEEHNPVLSPGKYGKVSFSAPVQFGHRVLAAGTYEFHCFHKGQYHLMAVYRVSGDATSGSVALGKPVATDYCRMEALREKVKITTGVTTKDSAGNLVLKEVRIEGEQVRHIFNEPFQLSPDDDN